MALETLWRVRAPASSAPQSERPRGPGGGTAAHRSRHGPCLTGNASAPPRVVWAPPLGVAGGLAPALCRSRGVLTTCRTQAPPEAAPEARIEPDSHDSWKEAWDKGSTGWHSDAVNPHLEKFVRVIAPEGEAQRIIVPLCGRSVDVAWLAALDGRKHTVIGVELHEGASEGTFKDAGLDYQRSVEGDYVKFQGKGDAANMVVYVGDFFGEALLGLVGKVTAIFDRACTVALPPDLRKRFAGTIRSMAGPKAVHLAVTFSYDQSRRAESPYSVPLAELEEAYSAHADVKLLQTVKDEMWSALVGPTDELVTQITFK